MIDQELWARIKAGDEDARDQLVRDMLPLVKRVSTKLWRSLPAHVDVNDIISYGNMGLLRAIENYDPTRGVYFETYAAASVRSLILDGLRAEDWAPRSLRRKQREVDHAREKLIGELDRQPSVAEIAQELDCTEADVVLVQSRTEASYHKSLDEGDPDRDWGCSAVEDPGNESNVEVSRAHEALATLVTEIRMMPLLDQAVLALRYYKGYKLVQVGQVLGITEMKASNIHSRAVVRIRSRLQVLLSEELFSE